MNKISFYFILSFTALAIFSCNKDDDSVTFVPPRDFQEQYDAEKDSIIKYLETHYIKEVVDDNGFMDIIIDTIPKNNTEGLVSIMENTQFPIQSVKMKSDVRTSHLTDGVISDTVEYTVYYFMMNEGGGQQPVTIDSTFTTYRGWRLSDNGEFEKNRFPAWSTYPVVNAGEQARISGYRQFVSLLKSATGNTQNPDGTITFQNSGVGVVFLPSGLAYFNQSLTGIPGYTPTAFLIRLHNVRERDHDRDGIKSKYEDLNSNNNYYDDDTDGDKIPDYLDTDDDGDGYTTKTEIKIPGTNSYYPFENIPFCTGGNKKRHLDPSCYN